MISQIFIFLFFLILLNLCLLFSIKYEIFLHLVVSVFFTTNYYLVLQISNIKKIIKNQNKEEEKSANVDSADDHPIIKSARERLKK